MATRAAQIMQAAGDLNELIGNAFFGQAQEIFDHATAFDTSNRMFNHDAHTRENRVEEECVDAQGLAFWLFLGCVDKVAGGS